MGSRGIRLCLALGLSLGFLAGSVTTGSAEGGPYSVYFPWVPNGAMLDDMGPFYGTVTIQNLEPEPVKVTIIVGWFNGPDTKHDVPAWGSITLSASEIGVPAPGSAVLAWSHMENGDNGRIAGVQKQSAPVAPDTAGMEARTSAAHTTVDGYTGLAEYELSSVPVVSVLPIVQTNSGWNTKIRVTPVGIEPEANIEVTIQEAGTVNTQIFKQTVAGGVTATFDLAELGVEPGFVGSAVVRSNPDALLIAVAERYKASTNMLIMNIAKPRETCHTMHVAPLVFDNYFSWNTGISIINAVGVENDVTVTTFTTGGEVVDTTPMTIPPSGMGFIYTPASGTGDGFVGAAIITGSQALCATVDEVKYTGDQPDVGHAMSYPTTPFAAEAAQALGLPLAQKGSLATGHGDTTGIQIFNPSDDEALITVVAWWQDGSQEWVENYAIPAKESRTVYSMSIDLPEGFLGAALVPVGGGAGKVVAVSNNVNYAVEYDGSSSFPLVFIP
jgi:hypothetical protein